MLNQGRSGDRGATQAHGGLLAQTPTTNQGDTQATANQLFACKSIDKLISDSEEPERRLKKTLGPVSLTALGIGAVIGSGIFTVCLLYTSPSPRDS